ncbi:uncharacterized protein LOC129600429 [Paramacrobiotus metropolitanus]|uniref:uncharacterized protein LOC129600429 n=1 Tax=Paramacrobiotus metropolitanus TaxID=2943436 RepID=UPI002445D850|nr:uncharacterized protein LOC129600429 [Paramacrobiotus metropolitanus]XP_055354905.1 uncharacterized protein LOC129600429 [Paramacrobiotus metropolitanus]
MAMEGRNRLPVPVHLDMGAAGGAPQYPRDRHGSLAYSLHTNPLLVEPSRNGRQRASDAAMRPGSPHGRDTDPANSPRPAGANNNRAGGQRPAKQSTLRDFFGRRGRMDEHYRRLSGQSGSSSEVMISQDVGDAYDGWEPGMPVPDLEPTGAPPPALPQYDERQQRWFRNNESYQPSRHPDSFHIRQANCTQHPYAWARNGLCRACGLPWRL